MKPVPSSLLLVLLLALCGLCAWQWQRESALRRIVSTQLAEVNQLVAERSELESRAKAADAEILRLTGTLAELKANSVDKQTHDEVLAANTTMRESIEKQNTAIKDLNETIAKASLAIQQANESITKLTTERDALAKRLNEVTAKYNALAKQGGG